MKIESLLEEYALYYGLAIIVLGFVSAWWDIRQARKKNAEAEALQAQPKKNDNDVIADRLNNGYPL